MAMMWGRGRAFWIKGMAWQWLRQLKENPASWGNYVFGWSEYRSLLGKILDKTQATTKESFRPGSYMIRKRRTGRTGKDGLGWCEMSKEKKAATIIQIKFKKSDAVII